MIIFKLCLLYFIFIIPTFSNGVTIECKKRNEMCIVSSNLKILEQDTKITSVNSAGPFKSLLFKNIEMKHLPGNLSSNFPQLEILSVSNATLIKLDVSDFEGLDNLSDLKLIDCSIKILPENIFHNLKNIKKIFLDNNKISTLPSTIFRKNVELVEISIMNNHLQSLNDETFKDLKNLKKIHLRGNKLEDVKSGTFNDNAGLILVNLRNNNLKYIPDDIFLKNKNLQFNKNYFIENKCIDSAHAISKYDDFVEIIRENCKPMNHEVIKKLKSEVEELNVILISTKNENAIKSAEIDKLQDENQKVLDENSKLQDEILKCNEEMNNLSVEISSLKFQLNASNEKILFMENEEKDNLTIKDNQIKDLLNMLAIRSHEIYGLNKLHSEKIKTLNDTIDELKAQNQEISHESSIINPNSTNCLQTENDNQQLNTISKINISCNFSMNSNKILSPQNVSYTCNIKDLVLLDCNSKIHDVQGQHHDSKSNNDVSVLSVSSSIINKFSVNYFSQFMNLKHLIISEAKFGKIENFCNDNLENILITRTFFLGYSVRIENCLKLARLVIESCNLKNVEIDNCKSLTDLSLKENDIEKIPENFFSHMRELINVQFSKNKLENIDGKLFKNNLKLEVINFSENRIKTIGSEFLNVNRNLIIVNFQKAGCVNGNFRKNDIVGFKRQIIEKCNK